MAKFILIDSVQSWKSTEDNREEIIETATVPVIINTEEITSVVELEENKSFLQIKTKSYSPIIIFGKISEFFYNILN